MRDCSCDEVTHVLVTAMLKLRWPGLNGTLLFTVYSLTSRAITCAKLPKYFATGYRLKGRCYLLLLLVRRQPPRNFSYRYTAPARFELFRA